MGETNFKLYPSEEKKFYLEKRMRLLTLYGGNPCAMVRVGKGKVQILHTFIYEPRENFIWGGDLFAFGTCFGYGLEIDKSLSIEKNHPKVFRLDVDCFKSYHVEMDSRFRSAKKEFEFHMGLEFTTYRDTFSYEVGMLDKGARIYNGLGNNGHHGDMPQWEYERRFYGIGPRLERKHFLDDYQYEDYVEWRDLRDQPKRDRWEFSTEEEYEEYLDLRWDVDQETMEDVLREYALVSRGILFGWGIYSWLIEKLDPDTNGCFVVDSATIFEMIANTPHKNRARWMDEMAYFLWTTVAEYPDLVKDKLVKEEAVTSKQHCLYSTCKKLQKAYIKWCDQKDIWRKETIQVQRRLNEGQDDSCDACEGNGGNAKNIECLLSSSAPGYFNPTSYQNEVCLKREWNGMECLCNKKSIKLDRKKELETREVVEVNTTKREQNKKIELLRSKREPVIWSDVSSDDEWLTEKPIFLKMKNRAGSSNMPNGVKKNKLCLHAKNASKLKSKKRRKKKLKSQLV